MLVTFAGLVVIALVALFVAWPILLARGGERDATETPSLAARLAQQKDKEDALAAIKDAEFDHQLGKLSDEDYSVLRAELEARAIAALVALDEPPALRRVPGSATAGGVAAPAATAKGSTVGGSFCPQCGRRSKKGQSFCPNCGRKSPTTGRSDRRRA